MKCESCANSYQAELWQKTLSVSVIANVLAKQWRVSCRPGSLVHNNIEKQL
jgi:hypothetical protein